MYYCLVLNKLNLVLYLFLYYLIIIFIHGVNLTVSSFGGILGAGTGSLGLAIEGPSEAKMTCKDNRDGSCSVEYTPTEIGEYDVSIKYAEKHIPGSPFKVNKIKIMVNNN